MPKSKKNLKHRKQRGGMWPFSSTTSSNTPSPNTPEPNKGWFSWFNPPKKENESLPTNNNLTFVEKRVEVQGTDAAKEAAKAPAAPEAAPEAAAAAQPAKGGRSNKKTASKNKKMMGGKSRKTKK